jgi:hypothetical protein
MVPSPGTTQACSPLPAIRAVGLTAGISEVAADPWGDALDPGLDPGLKLADGEAVLHALSATITSTAMASARPDGLGITFAAYSRSGVERASCDSKVHR